MSQSQYEDNLKLVSRIADAWTAAFDDDEDEHPQSVVATIGAFRTVREDMVFKAFRRRRDFSDQSPESYIVGPPARQATPQLYPVAKLLLSRLGDDLSLSVRVATFYEFDNQVRCLGWRVDMGDREGAEPTSNWNPGPHMQPIVGWDRESLGFTMDADSEPDFMIRQGYELNTSRPAFPIRARTPYGLLIACLLALYGVPQMQAILQNVRLPDDNRELDLVLFRT